MRGLWDNLSATQRIVLAAIVVIVAALLLGSVADAVRYRAAFKESQRELGRARQDAKDALKTARQIAEKLTAVNEQLKSLEEKRNETGQKYDRDARAVRDLRNEYDRVRRESVRANEYELRQLCGELADLGYECR